MVAVPAVGTVSPSSARMLVVFPEPFGPRNAVIRPGRTSTERSSTAVRVRYRFVREVKEMATGAPCGSVGAGGRAGQACSGARGGGGGEGRALSRGAGGGGGPHPPPPGGRATPPPGGPLPCAGIEGLPSL